MADRIDHRAEADARLRASDWQRQEAGDDDGLDTAMHEAAIAQVHATLALADVLAPIAECLATSRRLALPSPVAVDGPETAYPHEFAGETYCVLCGGSPTARAHAGRGAGSDAQGGDR